MLGGPWQSLRDELDRWADAGRRADFWLRDDDAVAPTPALEELLALTGEYRVPLLLAVIPEPAGKNLADRLHDAGHVRVGLHGWSHANHAPTSEKKQEFGPHRPHEMMLREVDKGRQRLESLFGGRFVPVFVPPWNRIDRALVPSLPEAGIAMLSSFGPGRGAGPLRELNSTVDTIDWHGGRGGREDGELAAEIVAQLRRAFDGGQEAVGVLAHHLVHDAAAWRFLDRLFSETARHPGCRWRTFAELAAETRDG